MDKYNYTIIESWWRHNGIWDRQDASGILIENYDGETELYLESTDDWWDRLTDEEKLEVYNEFLKRCNMDREKLEFRYFFNAGLDRITCECDVEGSDVFYEGHYVGSVKWVLPDELAEFDDDELEEQFAWNGIIL